MKLASAGRMTSDLWYCEFCNKNTEVRPGQPQPRFCSYCGKSTEEPEPRVCVFCDFPINPNSNWITDRKERPWGEDCWPQHLGEYIPTEVHEFLQKQVMAVPVFSEATEFRGDIQITGKLVLVDDLSFTLKVGDLQVRVDRNRYALEEA